MTAYHIQPITTWDGARRWHVWWNPWHYRPTYKHAQLEKVGSFRSPTEVTPAIEDDRHRRAGEST